MQLRLGLIGAASALVLLLGACGGGDDDPEPSDASAQDNGGDTGPTDLPVETTDVETEVPPPSDLSGNEGTPPDICELITPEEVDATLGGDAEPTLTGSYGSTTDPAGGQCIWTTDPGGDPFASDASNLELVVFQPTGPLPPPNFAPAPGSDEVYAEFNQIYFAGDDAVFLLRVTGALVAEEAVHAAAEELVPAIRDRA